jgi:hypothetical protein
MRMRAMVAGVAATAALGLAATGCGSSSSTGSSSLGGAASVAPSNSVAFVALDSDVSSGQWEAVDGLIEKFPGYDDVLASLRKSFEQHSKLSWENDVKPALGSELDLIALPGKRTQVVGLTLGSDQAKLDALFRKLDKGIVTEQIDGWTAFSKSQTALDAVKSAKTKLSDNNTFREATAKLAGDALVRAYANGTEAQQLLASLGKQTPSISTPPFAWASADLVASGDGVRVNGYSHDGSTQGVAPRLQRTPTAPYTSSLVDEIPAGALLVADFQVTPGEFQFSDMAPLPKALKSFLDTSPTFLAELDDILGGETAVYVRSGLPIPEVTIVTQPDDTKLAEQSLADVLKTLRAAGAGTTGGGLNLASIPVYHDVAGGQLIISTSQQGIADFRSAGPKLSSDPSFASAVKTAGMPEQTTGFIYANLASVVPLVQLIGPALGLSFPPALAKTDFSALKTLTAFGTRAGEESTFSVFLEVR